MKQKCVIFRCFSPGLRSSRFFVGDAGSCSATRGGSDFLSSLEDSVRMRKLVSLRFLSLFICSGVRVVYCEQHQSEPTTTYRFSRLRFPKGHNRNARGVQKGVQERFALAIGKFVTTGIVR